MNERLFERGYALLSLCQATLHNVFLIYYVQVYVYVFAIDQRIFWLGQIVFLIWNSLNDPLFGYLFDRRLLMGHHSSKQSIIRSKIHKIRWCGPLLALSFCLFWSPIVPVGINFIIALCLYDSFLTIVDLSLSSIMSDYSPSNAKRARLSKARSVGNILASLIVFISYCVWDRDNIGPFKTFCFTIAFFAALGFYWGTVWLLANVPIVNDTHDDVHDNVMIKQSNSIHVAFKYMSQLCQMRNFALFIAMSLVQVFHCHFNSNFMPLFLEVLLQNQLPEYFCPLIMGVSFLLPHLNNFYFLELCTKRGTYSVIKLLLTIKLVTAVIVYIAENKMIWLIAIFIASNRIFTEGICKLCDLIISDLIDEDYVRHDRQSTASSFVFGSAALLTKPGQTFAPLLGTMLLGSSAVTTEEPTDHSPHHLLVLAMVPFVCAVIQLLLWANYDLTGSKLAVIKSAVNKVHLV